MIVGQEPHPSVQRVFQSALEVINYAINEARKNGTTDLVCVVLEDAVTGTIVRTMSRQDLLKTKSIPLSVGMRSALTIEAKEHAHVVNGYAVWFYVQAADGEQALWTATPMNQA
jgi:hypothetical protein